METKIERVLPDVPIDHTIIGPVSRRDIGAALHAEPAPLCLGLVELAPGQKGPLLQEFQSRALGSPSSRSSASNS